MLVPMSNPDFITAPVRIIEGRPYPVRVGATIMWGGKAHVITAVEQDAHVLRISPVGMSTLSAWVTIA